MKKPPTIEEEVDGMNDLIQSSIAAAKDDPNKIKYT